jgi:hypothetical protein|nr:MAG TPA: hypothetical protein [Caudoviricetes sp.]
MTFAQNPELFTVIFIVTIEIALIILCGINKIWNKALLPEIDDDTLKIFFFGNFIMLVFITMLWTRWLSR